MQIWLIFQSPSILFCITSSTPIYYCDNLCSSIIQGDLSVSSTEKPYDRVFFLLFPHWSERFKLHWHKVVVWVKLSMLFLQSLRHYKDELCCWALCSKNSFESFSSHLDSCFWDADREFTHAIFSTTNSTVKSNNNREKYPKSWKLISCRRSSP